MKVIGLDLSLTSTGLAITDGKNAATGRLRTKPNGDELTTRHDRLSSITQNVGQWATGSDLAVIEGLAFSSKSGQATERAGLWWLTVDYLMKHDIPVAIVAPTVRAKYATGKGNAGKDEVLAAVIRRFMDLSNLSVSGNDEADALILAAMGARHLGHPIDTMPKAHTDAMSRVQWPGLVGDE